MRCYSIGPGGDVGFRHVEEDYAAKPGELLAPRDKPPSAAALEKAFPGYDDGEKAKVAQSKVIELGRKITPIRLAEAILGVDGGWLKEHYAKIVALRPKPAAPAKKKV